MQVSVRIGSSFPRRRESRPVGAETYRITRFPQPCILDSHFRGNDGGAVSAFSNKCPQPKIRHSRAGGNLDIQC
ncbi:hypothetical protein EUA23_07670 [Neisseria meningitidis]|nr:hypothetical protein EUA23_07670 [Neisseria meningitidis]